MDVKLTESNETFLKEIADIKQWKNEIGSFLGELRDRNEVLTNLVTELQKELCLHKKQTKKDMEEALNAKEKLMDNDNDVFTRLLVLEESIRKRPIIESSSNKNSKPSMEIFKPAEDSNIIIDFKQKLKDSQDEIQKKYRRRPNTENGGYHKHENYKDQESN